MSRIDRFLLSENWCQQWGIARTISYHCPLILKEGEDDWGPRPFRVLDCWFDHPDFVNFVKEKWSSKIVNGKACFVLKEKLKSLKSDLKEWNRVVFGNLDRNVEATTEALNKLDLEAETRPLSIEESLIHQKSRFKWLRKGDSNSSFFP